MTHNKGRYAFQLIKMSRKKPTNIRNILAGSFLACALYTAPTLADVQTITHGKSLIISCQQALNIIDQPAEPPAEASQNDAFLCMAYLAGIMATAQHANELARLRFSLATEGRGNLRAFRLYCFDWQAPYKRIAQIVLEFGRKQPHYLQRPAHELAMRALQTAYPCR